MNRRELTARLTGRLDPLGATAPGVEHSDWDLNPGWRLELGNKARAAVLIPIVDRPEGPTILLTRRAEALSNHPGQIAFPGGRIEPGETPEAAALREAAEEVGLVADRVTLLGRSGAYRTVTGFAITPVVGLVAPPFELTLNPGEVADAFEVPLAVILDEGRYERRFYEAKSGRRDFYAIVHGERVIWGATAGMLRALRARLVNDMVADTPHLRGAA